MRLIEYLDLHCPKRPPALREVYGLSRADVARIRTAVADHLSILCVSWEAIHGEV